MENWAQSLTYTTAALHRPRSTEEIQSIVRHSRRAKALGTRHSFSTIADSTGGDHISLEHLDRVLALNPDPSSPTVTVQAGITCSRLSEHLHTRGYALHNLASLPHISVAGACATATHGSGDRNANLATAVTAMKMVAADGELVELSSGDEDFLGAVVGLGALGIVTELTLRLVPAFQVRQDVFENLPLAQLEHHFDEILSSAYSVSLFTDWRSATFNQVWFKSREDSPLGVEPQAFGATRAPGPLHPIATLSAENCTEQMGLLGPWHERLPHFRAAFTPSSGEELQSEYLVPREHIIPALRAVDDMRDEVAPLLQISEVRTVAADDLWMSPCYRQACVGIHFTWKKDWVGVSQLLPKIETRLEPYDARPHWAKLFTIDPGRMASLYARLPDFGRLMRATDPQGKFRNAFLDRYLGAG